MRPLLSSFLLGLVVAAAGCASAPGETAVASASQTCVREYPTGSNLSVLRCYPPGTVAAPAPEPAGSASQP